MKNWPIFFVGVLFGLLAVVFILIEVRYGIISDMLSGKYGGWPPALFGAAVALWLSGCLLDYAIKQRKRRKGDEG